MWLQLLLGLTLFVAISKQLSLPTDPTYHAGVVEFTVQKGTAKQRTEETTNLFLSIIRGADVADLDMLVFPEVVLNSPETATFVPDPAQNVTPCFMTDYDVFLVELSCAARSRGIYLVVNMQEKELCGKGYGADTWAPCPNDGVRIFNTNVVFDRTGKVISRYRKSHLWRREYKTRAVLKQADISTFTTDFGVTFGHFICFDMMFYEPAMRLVLEKNITDIIYPTYWFSELPFLTAIQLQEGWAYANDVNLLAADGSWPETKTTGSGIYAGRLGRLNASIYEQPTRQLLKAHVPKRIHGQPAVELPTIVLPRFQPLLTTQRITQVDTYRDFNLDIFATILLPLNFLNVSQRVCHNAFCCEFELQRRFIDNSNVYAAYRYRLGAYFGNETTVLRVDRTEQAVCALFACRDAELISCGSIFPAGVAVANTHYFEQAHVSGDFPAAARRLIMPSTLNGVFMPLPVAQYEWLESPAAKLLQRTRVNLTLTAPQNDLLTFGIWANYFTQLQSTHGLNHMQAVNANSNADNNSSNLPALNLFLLSTLFVLLGVFNKLTL
ncbi:Btd [Drosophila busckii]|uniref:Btd n=1 Tax=Drosophila busckii TaxID=30019 RepID=A0A0M5J361_DROBS|nr:vanin-like protein 2 [Drosophila busckii]ALC48761.1 Btd [Drosophila busckii]